MKRIAVVATEKEYANFLKENLAAYLKRYADLRSYSLEEVEAMDYMEEEFVAISFFHIFQQVKEKILPSSELIVLSLALNREKVAVLSDLPPGTRALLVNYDYRTCMQTITSLHWAGFRNLELTPYYGQEEFDHTIKLAITPNEAHRAPKEISRIIDIGESVADLNCVYELADKLGVKDLFDSEEAIRAKNKVLFTNSSMERVLGENEGLTERLNMLIKLMKQGILVTDITGRIHLCNEKAEILLKNRSERLVGFNISELLPELGVTISDHEMELVEEELISIDGENIIASAVQIKVGSEVRGHIVTLDDFEEVEEQQHGMRSKLSKASHTARYRFDEIQGNSTVIRETIAAARRMARSDSSILITGESGTGKEIFAQSIHNESLRRKYNFVAVNCAAIPENLLESEMFGYEEGSFTGAKKGGKIGYFELAHKGTIFLDEIAEMPVVLQSKLLRVIEERKIIKIGSQKVVDVDVRIIAATNRDLYQMVEEGTFREDLYYRINVLPLPLPSLRERKEDIMILVNHFMDTIGKRMEMSRSAQNVLEEYPWKGNIRELRNAVEYMSNLEKNRIEQEDLPPAQQRFLVKKQNSEEERLSTVRKQFASNSEASEKLSGKDHQEVNLGWLKESEKRFVFREGKHLELYCFILEELQRAAERRERLGRYGLVDLAREKERFFSEMEIRRALTKMEDYGLVRIGRGRAGTSITQEGSSFYEKLKQIV